MTGAEHVKRALRAANVLGLGAVVEDDMAAEGTQFLRTIVDEMRRKRLWSFLLARQVFAMTSGTAVYAVGPGATWDTGAGARPTALEAVRRMATGSTRELLVNLLQPGDHATIEDKSRTASAPTDLLYEPGAGPTGEATLWPVPTLPGSIVLYYRSPMATFTTPTTDVGLPEGYDRWLDLKLASLMLPSMGRALTPDLSLELIQLEADIMANNIILPEWTPDTLPRRM